MSEIISFFVGIGVVGFLSFFKPEMVMKVLLEFLNQKINKKNANKIENALGVKLIETGIYTITFSPDDKPVFEEGLTKIKSGLEVIKPRVFKE